MSQSASSKAPALSMLGRKSYVSQRGLESVLTDLKASGLLADDVTSSRSSIKRAREEDLASLTGIFGPLVQKMEVPVDGQCKKTVVVPYIHPAAFLKHVFSLAPLWDFLRQEVLPHKETPSYARSWGLIFYADEVTPGNTLKANNSRKIQCIYWSISELGSRGLSSEALWFPLPAYGRTCVLPSAG